MKKWLSICLTVCLLLAMLPVTAAAAQEPVYLALGDSISTGYGLAASDPGFVDQIAAQYPQLVPVNHSVNGNTAEGIYAQLRDGQLDDLLVRAELITLTCGGNDLMAVLYVKIANLYNRDHPQAPIAPTDITAIFGGTHPVLKTDDLLNYAQTALQGFASSPEFQEGLEAYAVSLTKVLSYIRQQNPDTRVVIPTQYNPYNVFEFLPKLRSVYLEIEAGVLRLNEVIRACGQDNRCSVAEVYPVFRDSEENLCNAGYVLFAAPELDFHPNAKGHTVIADVILRLLAEPVVTVLEVSLSGLVTVDLQGAEAALAAAAFYSEEGCLLGLAMEPVPEPEGQLTLQAELSAAAAFVQVFLLDRESYRPLCPAIK